MTVAFFADEESYDPIEQVETLQNMLVGRATGDFPEDEEYTTIRARLLADDNIKPYLPRFVKTCRSLGQFWGYIKQYPTYAERSEAIWSEFRPLLEKLEDASSTPSDMLVSEALTRLNTEHVQQIWEQALSRRMDDPDGAITVARTLLESVCKLLLDEFQESYSERDDLPKLYRRVAQQLNLIPDQHTEPVFRQILGGCQSVVGGLASVRNKLGDAHGQGANPVQPAPRHAELAVNLAGAMALFLVQTWENQAKGN
ncbi:abortive infection family protein [Chloroflexota bacterium]